MNLLKFERMAYKPGHPWKNYRPMTAVEKEVRRADRDEFLARSGQGILGKKKGMRFI